MYLAAHHLLPELTCIRRITVRQEAGKSSVLDRLKRTFECPLKEKHVTEQKGIHGSHEHSGIQVWLCKGSAVRTDKPATEIWGQRIIHVTPGTLNLGLGSDTTHLRTDLLLGLFQFRTF